MINPSAPTTKPDFVSIEELMDNVFSGETRVPRFQRPYVWSPDDMIQLFDSVIKGYPIGSLLIWQTERADITSLTKIGPIDVPESGPLLKSYVVDGHQRLATLLGVLRLPEDFPRSRPDEWRWWIAYDLRSEQFVHLKDSSRDPPLHFLPLRDVLRTVGFARRTREIMGSGKYSETEVETLLDRADGLQRAIRNYRVPFTLLKSGSLDDAVTIFSRVNQRGRDMTADQMVSALTFRDKSEGDFDLAEVIDDVLGELRSSGFGDLERRIILQVILAIAGLDFTRTSYESLVDRRSHAQLRPAVSRAKSAIVATVDFLRNQVGVGTSRLLPYASIVVILAILVDSFNEDVEWSADLSAKMQRWFWAVSFNGWFAGANTTDMRQAANAMRKFAASKDHEKAWIEVESLFLAKPLRPFPETFDRRSARVRASLLVQILSGKPRDPMTGAEIDGAAIFANEATRDIPYFFPKQRKPMVSNVANRVILPGNYPRNARPIFAQNSLFGSDEILLSHFITADALCALEQDRFEDFIRLREAQISEAENKFLKQFNLAFDASADRSVEEYDSDE